MARRDQTGPLTGRGLGECRCGFRRGGARRGMRFFNEESSETPKEMLTSHKELLQERIDLIDEELEKL